MLALRLERREALIVDDRTTGRQIFIRPKHMVSFAIDAAADFKVLRQPLAPNLGWRCSCDEFLKSGVGWADIAAPTPWAAAEVYCDAHGPGALAFGCRAIPVSVNNPLLVIVSGPDGRIRTVRVGHDGKKFYALV